MKEILGGCCVCLCVDGWDDDPIVFCDGQNCNVAVHRCCYGIITVPSGPWFCRKCESLETEATVRCELCPSETGAFKRTDNERWAHIVCALYIPEVTFGDFFIMEPIVLDLIPQERFSKRCCICDSQGNESNANIGACMNCKKPGCQNQFHATCAQALGLLCELEGNFTAVTYCGYCPHHFSQVKKGAKVKAVTAFKSPLAAGELFYLALVKSNSSEIGKFRSAENLSDASVCTKKGATQRQQDLAATSIQQEAAVEAPPGDTSQNHPEPETYHKKVSPIYAFYWINGPEMGSVEDHLENKFAWDQQLRKDGSVGYRCCHKMMGADKEERCPAVARRFFKTPDGVPLILLQEPHNHRSGVKRNADTGIQSGGPGPSGASKRSCADVVT